ncbi:MAG TPA: hypothetical protein VJL34_03060 [Anaerolineales bacterium]|nr:hypothetical protein [Anaerolineales bacterium]
MSVSSDFSAPYVGTTALRAPIYMVLIALLCVACQQAISYQGRSPAANWAYTDLRILDPADAPLAEQDILAVYERKFLAGNQMQLEIRLDFLSLSTRSQADIYLAIDHESGGSQDLPLDERDRPAQADIHWDTLLVFPSRAPLLGQDMHGKPRPNLALRAWQDPIQDTININFNRDSLPSGLIDWQMQVFTASPESRTIVDRVKPVSLDGRPPAQAGVLFAFWNSFPAYTPAQAVRRWAGAHTGPLGGSHGLAFLLRSSQEYNIPVTLLDLSSPVSLAALDYAGGLELVQKLAAQEQLILPAHIPLGFGDPTSAYHTAPAWLLEHGLESSLQSARNFGLPTTQFVYAFPQIGFSDEFLGVFSPVDSPSDRMKPVEVHRLGQLRVIPIPAGLPNEQATLDGPSIEVRKALIDAAIGADPSKSPQKAVFLVLGGDLTQSTWGEPRRARATFEYIRAHPWIKPLHAYDLLTLAAVPFERQDYPESGQPLSIPPLDLPNAPADGKLAQAAWQTFLALNAPVAPSSPMLTGLRMNYLGQVGALLTASDWEMVPRPIASCQTDPDLDSERECILASESVFTISEIPEGSLVYAFVRTASGVHQIIGPSSQLAVGLSDPASWNLEMDERADPSVMMGAFADANGSYLAEIQEDKLVFKNQTNVKIYSLTPTGVTLTYVSQAPSPLQIPILLDPWDRYTPGWGERYYLNRTPDGVSWSLEGGITVQIIANAPLEIAAFTDTRSRMGLTENPNFDYPAGHYLPFPMALVQLGVRTDVNVTIEVRD